MARGAFDKHINARKSNVLNLFWNQPFWVSQTFVIYFLSYGRFLIKRIYCKFLPNSDINGPVNRQFSQASRRKPFGPLFYSQTFGSLTAGPLVENHFLAIKIIFWGLSMKSIWAIILSQTIDCDEKQGKHLFCSLNIFVISLWNFDLTSK